MEVILGIDVGTTGTKVVAFDAGTLVEIPGASSYATHPTHTADAGATIEQDPRDWEDGIVTATTATLSSLGRAGTVIAVGLSGQMQSVLPVGGPRPQHRAILYSDSRASVEAAELEALFGGQESLQSVSGNYKGAPSCLCKLRWLLKNEPGVLEDCDVVLLSAGDWATWWMTGGAAVVTDFTNASVSGLMDPQTMSWLTSKALPYAERRVITSKLPALRGAAELSGRLCGSVAARLGLPAGIPVVHGAGDLGTTTIGAAAVSLLAGSSSVAEGFVAAGDYIYLGTSGWVARTLPSFPHKIDAALFAVHDPCDPTRCVLAAPCACAGGNVELVRAVFGSSYEEIDRMAAQSPPGAGGVFFLPHLAGERCPVRAPSQRGGWVGLNPGTTRSDMFRAVLEGVAFQFCWLLGAMGGSGGGGGGDRSPAEPLVMVGGGAKSKVWREIVSSVLGRGVVWLDCSDVTCLGAATLAREALMKGGGSVPKTSGPATAGPEQRQQRSVLTPDASAAALYSRHFPIWLQFVESLRTPFEALAEENRRGSEALSQGNHSKAPPASESGSTLP